MDLYDTPTEGPPILGTGPSEFTPFAAALEESFNNCSSLLVVRNITVMCIYIYIHIYVCVCICSGNKGIWSLYNP